MKKYGFLDDYSEGCHPSILKEMTAQNMVQQNAYGDDDYCAEAKLFIRRHLGQSDVPIFFVSGGTLANIIIISSALRPHEAVISASSGHIYQRETGAIEATGHKIITVPSSDGKLTPQGIERALALNAQFPHMTRPRLVYLSNATESGTIYSFEELSLISKLCKDRDLLLMLDGARLGAALTADSNDLSLQSITQLVDVFWIGGTKAGALIGEAIVIPNHLLAKDFAFHIKQKGALLAKGRLLGQQFACLFRDELFFTLSKQANQLAGKISEGVVRNGYSLAVATESNQVFPVLPNGLVESLQESFGFYIWESRQNGDAVLRLVTSWATDECQVDRLIEQIVDFRAGAT